MMDVMPFTLTIYTESIDGRKPPLFGTFHPIGAFAFIPLPIFWWAFISSFYLLLLSDSVVSFC